MFIILVFNFINYEWKINQFAIIVNLIFRPQLIDVFGASRNVMVHEAIMEVFGNPVLTKRPDLCERYFWALCQLEHTPGKIAKGN